LETYSSLLFELSSNDRLDILILLRKTPLKLSHVSSKLNFTVQETSRNIARLSDARLIAKDVEGAFHLTPYGEEALNLLSGFRFLFRNREYLTNHVLAGLPEPFRAGLGVLDSFELVKDVMISFHNIENMIAEAEKFVWILTNQVLISTLPYLAKALERGSEFKLLMPKDFVPSEGLHELVDNPVFAMASRTKKLESRFLDKVDAFLCLSEKQVAALGFPNLEGKLDYIGFSAENESAVEWAKVLFTHYWSKATSHVPEQLISK
jgi:predicted transcriptional regulator